MRVSPTLVYIAVATCALATVNGKDLAPTPPMGWMSWEIFRCDIDCKDDPTRCINEQLYQQQTDQLSSSYLAAGYNTIHIDDCWMQKDPPRDPVTHELVANKTRFPSGMRALADYMHNKGVKFGTYTAESTSTCGGYPASAGYEELDAKTFANWTVDYLKVDGCGNTTYYNTGYPAMGKALTTSGRDIVYSCSWPAYLGDDETKKPFQTMINSHCNLWRNWRDIQCNWDSLSSIIDHWGDYGDFLQTVAAPGHWNDPDMLLIGNDCITDDEARTQMAIWSISAAPLIMGNDLRNVSDSAKAILLNKEAIAVDQDPKGAMGRRITPKGDTEVWARNLSDGSVAFALYNKNAGGAACEEWNITADGYIEACKGAGGDETCFSGVDLTTALETCCGDGDCAAFSYRPSDMSGCYKKTQDCGKVVSQGFLGFAKPNFKPGPQPSGGANITVDFSNLGFKAGQNVKVRDIWAQKDVGTFSDMFTAEVPLHGTGFYRASMA